MAELDWNGGHHLRRRRAGHAPEVAKHLVAIISTWAIFTGAMKVRAALKLRKAVDGGWILPLDALESTMSTFFAAKSVRTTMPDSNHSLAASRCPAGRAPGRDR